jgi:hypothetical protein
MSKSLGNSLLVDVMVTKVRPVGCATTWARPLVGDGVLAEAGPAVAAYQGVGGSVCARASSSAHRPPPGALVPQRGLATVEDLAAAGIRPLRIREATGPLGQTSPAHEDWPPGFAAALTTPDAPGARGGHATITGGSNALAAGDTESASAALASVRAMLGVLGLDPLAEPWVSRGADDDLYEVVDALVKAALAERRAARDRRDYAAADAIRDQLRAAGVLIEDTPEGPRWELKR